MTTTVPIHPPQSINEVLAGAGWLDHGGGRYGPRIPGAAQAKALYNTRTIPMVESRSVMMVAEVRSTLVVTDNGYEGYGLSVCGLRREGNGTRVVFWNDPVQSGNSNYWLTDQHSDWTTVYLPVVIPETEETAEFLDCALVVRAPGGGYLDVDMMTIRAHYLETQQGSAGPLFFRAGPYATWAPMENVQTWLQDSLGTRSSAETFGQVGMVYLDTIDASIPKGTRLRIEGTVRISDNVGGGCSLGGINPTTSNVESLPFVLGVGVKVRYQDGTGELYRLSDYYTSLKHYEPGSSSWYPMPRDDRFHQFAGTVITRSNKITRIDIVHYIGPIEGVTGYAWQLQSTQRIDRIVWTCGIEDQVLQT